MGVWNDFKTGVKMAVTGQAGSPPKEKKKEPVAKPRSSLDDGVNAIAENIRKKKAELEAAKK